MTDDQLFHNPVDMKTYVVRSGWKTYEPETRRPDDPTRKVKLEQVWLLTCQADICARTTPAEVAAFVLEAERLAEESLGKSGEPFRVMVQFTCEPCGHEVKLARQGGEAAPELLQDYLDALATAKRMPVDHGDVTVLAELSISPGVARDPLGHPEAADYRGTANHRAVHPASMTCVAPVMPLASSEQRKRT